MGTSVPGSDLKLEPTVVPNPTLFRPTVNTLPLNTTRDPLPALTPAPRQTATPLPSPMGTLVLTPIFTEPKNLVSTRMPVPNIPTAPNAGPSGPMPFDPTLYTGKGNAFNCNSFASQAQAQAVLRADPRDPNGLDADHDGIACEHNRAPKDLVPVVRAAPAITSTGGCGSRGGPGYRLANGRCASWPRSSRHR